MADIKQECNDLRDRIKQIGAEVKNLQQHDFFTVEGGSVGYHPEPDLGEMRANIQLAYRHLEDARMRLGKTIQALEGGVSKFDK
jgi:hypothetical protein